MRENAIKTNDKATMPINNIVYVSVLKVNASGTSLNSPLKNRLNSTISQISCFTITKLTTCGKESFVVTKIYLNLSL